MNRFLYPIAHGAVDFSCALLLFRFFRGCPDYGAVLLLYNFCAFALQMPLGILADKWNRNHALAGSGMMLVGFSFLLTGQPLISAVTAGLGNACFHLGGGLEVLNEGPKAGPLGRFVAPGALGLFLGTLYGKGTLSAVWVPLMMLLSGLALLRKHHPSANAAITFPRRLPILLALFAVVVLRCYLGFAFHFSWNTTLWSGLALCLATVFGKYCGGHLLDRFGWRKTVVCTMVPAALCLVLGSLPPLGFLGMLLFQTTMPLTLWGAARLAPGLKGFAFGLLTFGLFLGFLPVYFQWPLPQSPWIWGLGALGSGLLLLPCERGLKL